MVGVTAEWRPASLAGIGSQSPAISIVDAAGETAPFVGSGFAFEVLTQFGRSRTAKLHGWTGAQRAVDYSAWLRQAVP